jgi:hypothetical protein
MKNAFIVSSAIKPKGYTKDEQLVRLQQTINTIHSIKLKAKDADIFLVDSGSTPIDQEWLKLFPKDVKVLSLSGSQRVDAINSEASAVSEKLFTKYKIKNKSSEEVKNFIKMSYLKSFTEHFAISVLFTKYDFSIYDMIFKISGRYFLNEDFDLNMYGKGITFKKIGKNSACTILWSCSSDNFAKLKDLWPNVLKHMLLKYNSNKITDIEQCMYLTYSESDIPKNYINKLGVTGIVNNPLGKRMLSL